MAVSLKPNDPLRTPVPATSASSKRPQADKDDGFPSVSAFLLRGFNWYVPRYLRRHFNAIRVAKPGAAAFDREHAVICYANHPGWWDPLLAILMNQLYMDGRTAYAPIDRSALQQYPVFRRLGFYGIDLETLEGAKQFLYVTRRLLSDPATAIWMTPGGRFSDARNRDTFQPGIAHIAASTPDVTLVPLAVEYTFWEERTPEALIEFGQPIRSKSRDCNKTQWQAELQSRLAAAQDSLAEKVISRDSQRFEVVIDGTAGVGGWYDLSRRIRSLLTGKHFRARHGRQTGRNQLDA